VAMKHKKL